MTRSKKATTTSKRKAMAAAKAKRTTETKTGRPPPVATWLRYAVTVYDGLKGVVVGSTEVLFKVSGDVHLDPSTLVVTTSPMTSLVQRWSS